MDQWLKAYDAMQKLYERKENSEVDMTKFAESDSKDLKAKDFIGKNIKVVISGVEIVHYEAKDDQPASDKARLRFEGKEKGLVLNTTNTRKLVEAYGADSDDWTGHEIGLSVADYTDKGYGHGWIVTPLDLPPPDFDDEPNF